MNNHKFSATTIIALTMTSVISLIFSIICFYCGLSAIGWALWNMCLFGIGCSIIFVGYILTIHAIEVSISIILIALKLPKDYRPAPNLTQSIDPAETINIKL